MLDPSAPSVLVSALDADLRHSLAFVLAAEGFSVESCAIWPPDYAPQALIVVVDEASLARPFVGDRQLHALGAGVVLLTNKADLARRLPLATIVRKPLLDRALVEAVNAAAEKAALPGKSPPKAPAT